MSKANYKFFTLLNPAEGGSGTAAFNRVEIVSNLASLAKKN